jgi:hypothetical protein
MSDLKTNNLLSDQAKNNSSKLQYRQAIITAIIGALAVFIPSIIKMMLDERKITQGERKITQLESEARKHNQEQLTGLYSWHWTNDDGWSVFGWVNIAEDGRAQLTLERWMMCESARKSKRVPLVEKNDSGRFEPSLSSSEVNVSLPVKFIVYDRNCKKTGLDPQTIQGKISPVSGYRGTVDYVSEKRGHFPGGMELLKVIPGGR